MLLYCVKCQDVRKYNSSSNKTDCSNCQAPIMYRCGRCNRHYKTINSLREHLKIRCNKEPRFTCPECGYKSFRRSNLDQHIRGKHADTNKCPKCDQIFLYHSQVPDHVSNCTGESQVKVKQPQVNIQPLIFTDASQPTRTRPLILSRKPRAPEIQYYVCHKCQKVFTDRINLDQHMKACRYRARNEPRPLIFYYCDHCDYKSTAKNILTNHMICKHIENESHNCEECGRKFRLISKMMWHKKYECRGVPMGTRQTCPSCGKHFSYAKAYEKHRITCQ